MLDFDKIRDEANGYAAGKWSCTVSLELDGEEQVGTYVLTDEEGEEIERLNVTDGGVYNNRQLMVVTDSEGEYLLEAFGTILVKVMYG